MNHSRFVILDRDGVINHDSDDYIKSPEEWIPVERSLEAIARLCDHGFRIVVVTNQSGIARGYFDLNTLERIHDKMRRLVTGHGGNIDAIYFCPHGPEDQCGCRKPATGLLEQFARDFGIALENLPLVGDSLRDLQAAQAVGAKPLLVRTGKGERTLQQHPDLNVSVFRNLYDASEYILDAG